MTRMERMDRRVFLRSSAACAMAAIGSAARSEAGSRAAQPRGGAAVEIPANGRTGTLASGIEEATIDDLAAGMQQGRFTSLELVRAYRERIEATNLRGPELRAVLELNPDAEAIAAALDEERRAGNVRGPLHGIPVLLKDNIDTADRMRTTAGSLALLGSRPRQDATVAARLREAGAVLLGKTNLSEWANIRSSRSSSGWSARGGQCRNPYVLTHSPCGSSSGSAVAVAASLCAVAVGTETDGSIVCPSHQNGVVGIKPTVGLTSRAGVVPISHTQDTIGPHARTVRDAAILLSALASGGVDPRDPATGDGAAHRAADYGRFLDPDGLRGARVGIPRMLFKGGSPHSDAVIDSAIAVMRAAGAEIVDPADIPSLEAIGSGADELNVLLYELKADMEAYLAGREEEPGAARRPPRTLADLIAFNEETRREEMLYFGQELFVQAQEKGTLEDPEYLEALERSQRLAGPEGIDAALARHGCDALVAPTGGPAWPIDLVNGDHFLVGSSGPAAMAGYPLINVPAGWSFGLPLGISFMGTAWSEPVLIRLAYAFEQTARARRPPRYLPGLASLDVAPSPGPSRTR